MSFKETSERATWDGSLDLVAWHSEDYVIEYLVIDFLFLFKSDFYTSPD
jgi:hypothetical protein